MPSATKSHIGGLRSMTGFAPLVAAHENWTIRGDIRAVNGRGLDVRLRVPDWIEELEPSLRKLVQSKVTRGSVTISLRVQRDAGNLAVRLNEGALTGALDTLSRIEAKALDKGVQLAPLTAADVATFRGVLEQGDEQVEDTGPLRKTIVKTAEEALAAFDADRAREGAALMTLLSQQIDDVDELVTKARSALGDREVAAREAMERALARVTDTANAPDEARVAQELAIWAVKSDVAEELDRLDTHVAAARDLITANGAVGRKLDFLMQEFNREANTLCSKAQSSALTTIGLDLKALIDQMREQVQNLE